MYILNEKIKNKSNIVRNLEIENLNNSVHLKGKHLKKGQLKHYPSSVKEWNNSIYSFKKYNSIKTLPLKDKMIYKLFDLYFNKLKDCKYNSLSMNKIFIGRPEIKHFNNKINVTIYIYNKWATYFFKMTDITRTLSLCSKLYRELLMKTISNGFIKLLYKYIYVFSENTKLHKLLELSKFAEIYKKDILLNKYILDKEVNVVNGNTYKEFVHNIKKNRYLYLYSMHCFFDYIKFPKTIGILKRVLYNLKEKKFYNLTIVLKTLKKIYFKKLKINSLNYLIKLIYMYLMVNKLLKGIYLLKWYKRNIFFGMYKFNSKNLLIMKSFINKLYNKKVEVNIVNLKYLYLDGNILALAIVKKLKNRKRRVLRVIRMALRLSKKPYFNKYYSNFLNINSLNNALIKKNLSLSLNNDCMLLNKDLIYKPISYKSRLIFYYLNYKVISGMKLQGTGRLTKRLTASRSISKSISKGSLKNRLSSYNGLSTIVLRGYVKSNLQYINVNSYNRIGAYSIKSWISNF